MSGLLTDDGWPAAHVVWSIELDVLRCTNCGAQRDVPIADVLELDPSAVRSIAEGRYVPNVHLILAERVRVMFVDAGIN